VVPVPVGRNLGGQAGLLPGHFRELRLQRLLRRLEQTRAGEDQAARPTSRPPPTHRAAAPERVCGTDHAPSEPGGRASKTSRISRILPPPQRLSWPITVDAPPVEYS